MHPIQLSRRHFLGASALTLLGSACARAQPRVCAPTAANIEGPFYRPGAPHRARLAGDGELGTPLLITGVVRDRACRPIAGTVLDLWQADSAGDYDLQGSRLRGRLSTDAEGRFAVRSIVPGRYLNGDTFRPAHVHVKLRAPGHAPLTTQLYFPGDPYNDQDPFIARSLIMSTRETAGVLAAEYDFVF